MSRASVGSETAAAPAPEGARVVPPGGVVGILGGGQLGRMLAMAAAKLGLRAHVYAPNGESPAAALAERTTLGSPDFGENIEAFAQACDVVTFETENIPLAAVDAAARFAPVRPSRRALEITQDRLFEKRFVRSVGAETTPFHAVETETDLRAGLDALGGGGVLKTRRMGYDGKGQARIEAAAADHSAEQARAAFAAMGGAPAILEAWAPFTRELSVVAARDADGRVARYDPAENQHVDGVLRRSVAPGAVSTAAAAAASAAVDRILEGLDYVGVLAVEFFEMPDGRLWVNEIAPRVHNSGHWTLEACAVSQFEQHVRAICGWPLGAPDRHADAEMVNLIGNMAADWRAYAGDGAVSVHLYGKNEARPGRKMGHVTRLLGPARG